MTSAAPLYDRRALPEQWRALLENVPDHVLAVDRAGTILYINHVLPGYTLDGVLGSPVSGYVAPDQLPTVMGAIRQVFETEQPTRYEVTFTGLHGMPVLFDVYAGPVSVGGSIVAVALISTDISLRRRAEEELRGLNETLEMRVAERTEAALAAERQLRESQKLEALGLLAGGIAHDFNNLLMVITGRGELLAADPLATPALLEGLREIAEAARRGASLVRHLLAFSRRQVVELRPVDLNAVVRNTSGMLRRVIGEDIELLLRTGATEPRVLADLTQVEQILMNLALNAREAMEGGGTLTIETAEVELAGPPTAGRNLFPGPYVRLAVSDTGVGMDEETRSHIFEPFFSTKGRAAARGLGLSVVYGIVQQCGGHIDVSSRPGHGTRFEILLRKIADASEPPPPPSGAGRSLRGSASILVVEDDPAVRKVVCASLREAGHQVLEAADGAQALQVVAAGGRIDLILTDVVMPKMGGGELAERVRRRWPDLCVLFMSGHPEEVIARGGVVGPGVSLVMKPFTQGQLLEKIEQMLGTGR